MHRPIGVILLAAGAGLAGLYQLYMMLVYLGIVDFPSAGQSVSFGEAQWGAALWSLLIAAIWLWVALGFWNLRAYAVPVRHLHQPVHADLGLLRPAVRQHAYEAQTIPGCSPVPSSCT